ncbi:MAG: flagellar filament capping protein FliD, partial [Planctomycetota bacterium]
TREAGDTLQDLADGLNDGDFGVTAEIVDDGTTLAPARLLLTATQTGEAGRFRLDDSGLAEPFSGARAGLSAEVSVLGEDALISVGANAGGGFLRADSDGSFEDLPGGVGVTIKQATGEPVTVTVGRDTSGIGGALNGFVTAYNALIDTADELTKVDTATLERGVLQGNAAVGRVLRRVEGLLTKRFGPSVPEDGAPRTLFDVGVRLERDGKISLNRERLDAALEEHPDAVRAFFQEAETGFAASVDSVIDGLTDPFEGLLELESDSLERRQADITARIGDLEEQLALKRDRLVRQFAAMEETVSQLNSFQSALSNIRLLEFDNDN